MRFLRLIRARYSLFKRLRIGFTLLTSSFKLVFFSHQNYIFFSVFLAVIQFMHLKVTGFIHHRLTLGILITELLAGENFFEILWHNAHFTFSVNNFFTLVAFIALLYLKIILIFFILSAACQYTFKQKNNSIPKSIKASLSHWRGICVWALFELFAQGFSSLVGDIGALLYFTWNIVTIFDIQLLTFEPVGAYQILKKTWGLFKKNFSEIVALDVIIEGLLVTAGLILYSISRRYMPNISLVESKDYNEIIIFLILYLISSVMIFETVVFTNLYKAIGKNDTSD